jgi:hypothetical protein
MLAGAQASKVRVAGLELLQQLFSPTTNLAKMDSSAEKLDIDSIVTKHLFGILAQSARVSGSLAQVKKLFAYILFISYCTLHQLKSSWVTKKTIILHKY